MDTFTLTELKNFVLDAIASNQFFQGGFVLAILTGALVYFKSIFLWIWQRLFRFFYYDVTITQEDKLYLFTDLYLQHKYSHKFKKVEVRYSKNKSNHYIKSIEDTDDNGNTETSVKVNNTPVNDVLFIWYKWRFLIIHCTRDRLEAAHSSYDSHYHEISISGFLAKNSIQHLVSQIGDYGVEYLLDFNKDNVEINVFSGGEWIMDSHKKPKPLDKIYFDEKESLMVDINEFVNDKQWYIDRSLRYSRGYLLYGPPGNGKTTIIHSLGRELNRTINVINLNNISDESLIKAMRELPPNSILAFEDIDAAFNEERKATKGDNDKGLLSFSTLLNCIDGTYARDNIIVIFTTNHKERLDSALIRTGRVDVKVHLDNPSSMTVNQYVSNFFNEDIKIDYKGDYSMSDIQNLCLTNKRDKDNLVEILSEVK